MTLQRIDVAGIAPQPWKNGAGSTREIAVSPPGMGSGDFDWRLSIARIHDDAPFSRYDGVDRCIALLAGAGMTLRLAGGRAHRLGPGSEPFRFDGEAEVAAHLDDGPCDDFNVMVRRGRWRAQVTMLTGEARFQPAGAGLLLAITGDWQCRPAHGTLGPMQAWLWREGLPATVASPLASSTPRALFVRLQATPR